MTNQITRSGLLVRDGDSEVPHIEDMLLDAWETAHGPLEERWVSRFRRHPALQRLTRFPRLVAIDAVTTNKRLDDALEYAERVCREIRPEDRQAEPSRPIPRHGTKTRHLLEVVALFEDQISPTSLTNDEKALWINHPATARMVGYTDELLLAAARRCPDPLTPEAWLVAARVEEDYRRAPAASVLEGRSDKYDHHPSRPGGIYKKGGI